MSKSATKNVTIKLDEELVRTARHLAVEKDQSLSQYIAELVRIEAVRRQRFDEVRRRAKARMRKGFHLGGKPLTREQAHER